ncbi:MAG: HpcH/HpaI aldolase/citrate lyase family protein [Culicoidibacterales bacterium]
MKYFTTLTEAQKALFALEPQVYTMQNREQFAYAIGANLYMSGLLDLYETIVHKVTMTNTVTICFEDAIAERDVPHCEQELIRTLTQLSRDRQAQQPWVETLPAIFIRPRNLKQFEHLCELITKQQLVEVAGFVLPKFDLENGRSYLAKIKQLAKEGGQPLYAMPILESRTLIYQETRMQQLQGLSQLFAEYRDYILNLRLGGTDFSAAFGLRRPVELSIYDLKVVADCFSEIINFFAREGAEYVISGPVWEYFSDNPASLEVQGLWRELQLDQANGLFGKTAIHPSQVAQINYAGIVTHEAYADAKQIINAQQASGVFKGEGNNKMNEIGPHQHWAKKILLRAHVYGVLRPGFQPLDVAKKGELLKK